MGGRAGLLEISAGSVLRLDGTDWTVAAVDAEDTAGPSRPRQPVTLDDLTDYQREVVRLRAAHLLEAETGFAAGIRCAPDPESPGPASTRGARQWSSGGRPRRPS